jgi:hypothetical protein
LSRRLATGAIYESGRTRGLALEGLRSWKDGGVAASDFQGLGDSLAAVTDGEVAYAANALNPEAAKLAESAKAALEAANSKDKPVTGEPLRQLLTKAALLDTAAATFGQSDGSIAARAIEKLNELHTADDVKAWSETLPQLKTKLDLVLRDQSLEQALAAVAKAAGVEIRLTEGSTADAAALTGQPQRINYLDLRHATVAEALDWILQPARLAWQPEGKAIVAASNRRRGEAGWTYDVSAIALPLQDELSKLDDDAKRLAAAQKAATDFRSAGRTAIKADEASLVWFAPGQLLLFGTPAQHAALAQTIATLQEGAGKPQEPLAALSDATRKRFAARKEKLAKAQAAERKLDVAQVHDEFSWQLLAAAAAGRVDLEALTELQIAWKAPQTAELLAGASRPLVLRSLWTICEASRVLPADKELAALATAAREKSAAAATAALIEAGTNKGSLPIMASAIYAALANPADRAYAAKLLTLLAASETDEATKDLRLIGRTLIGQASDADRQALGTLVATGVGGADPVALVALACRKAGGSTWSTFRAQSRDLLGEQPLPGDLVVLVNRLPVLVP